jgi:hypothetical protein
MPSAHHASGKRHRKKKLIEQLAVGAFWYQNESWSEGRSYQTKKMGK